MSASEEARADSGPICCENNDDEILQNDFAFTGSLSLVFHGKTKGEDFYSHHGRVVCLVCLGLVSRTGESPP